MPRMSTASRTVPMSNTGEPFSRRRPRTRPPRPRRPDMAEAQRPQVAIVTGASSGIGRACALAMDAAGMRLVIVGRSRERLEALAPFLSHEPVVVAGDVADPATTAQAVGRALESFGWLDILLANAGLYLPDRGWEVAPERVTEIVTTNVLGVMHGVHAALPTLIAQGAGDIVVT
ncbi:MAG: SDR family NAD(P)-dependent oxidoreductase, partial [Actinobacteria bacterium]|nr:SDR family NAD(P)-dependent oxidoreductase [Actinomycetota bacterium]